MTRSLSVSIHYNEDTQNISISYKISISAKDYDKLYCEYFYEIARIYKLDFSSGEDDFGTRFFYLSGKDLKTLNRAYMDLLKVLN